FVAHFFNSVLLGSAGGDLMKALYAARETHHLKAESVMTVVVDRLVGLFATLFFAAVMMIANVDLLRAHGRLTAVSGVVLGSLALVTVVAVLSFWGGLSRLWSNGRNLLARLPQGALIERSLMAARGYGRHPGTLLAALGWSMVLNTACVLQVWALTRGLGVHVPVRWLLVIIPVVVFLSSIPITPNGLGVRENLYVWMLTVPEIGMPATTALSLSLLAFAGSLLWSLVGGVVYLGFRRKHHLLEVAQASESGPEETSAPSPPGLV
ncbi:MAG: flippase-like domain-containing protein, partial [Verrucomicrobiae bacterium]|nr:flippase-like domain-containing protein [Verrucomicrobiae bacterium]